MYHSSLRFFKFMIKCHDCTTIPTDVLKLFEELSITLTIIVEVLYFGSYFKKIVKTITNDFKFENIPKLIFGKLCLDFKNIED